MAKSPPQLNSAPIPLANWNDEPTYCLQVNDEWVSHVLGVIALLDDERAWIGAPEAVESAREQVAEIMSAIMEACVSGEILVSPQDTVAGYLEDKLLPGSHISLTKNNAGANESLTASTDPALRTISLPFTYLIPTPQLIATLPAGALLSEVRLTVDTPFDGILIARIGVASDNELFMSGAENHVYLSGAYITNPDYRCLDVTEVYLFTVNSGVTQGAGRVTLVIED